MNEEFSASVCCSWDAVRITVEKGVVGADAVGGSAGADGRGLDASKAGLRGPRGGRERALPRRVADAWTQTTT
ncbi:hypothetical protein GCM10012285_62700 [Streptomyces kronopolitis]|uniref:Uncharacterized protein n=1 Tax=Streptomyces kronopolitis TaxID=1612435 RepID=A0ABQ2K383_9ACTN|nr:hypothetical protein GCM10012285_62700 [Streptomyces kronopolitis]